MKIKIYKVYYEGELDKIFFSRKRALEYKENLLLYAFEDINIEIEKGYVYVWYNNSIYGAIS